MHKDSFISSKLKLQIKCQLFQSPLLSARKNLSAKKKWNSSILCNKIITPNKETELENWKRRKNYDPMKAAAEGKKKDHQKQSSVSSKGLVICLILCI